MKQVLYIVFAVCMLGTSAFADDVKDSIISQLVDQGFNKIEVSRTFLGRSRITAKSATFEREIIFNPMTGEILRDYSTALDGTPSAVKLVDPNVSPRVGGGTHSGKGVGGSGKGGKGGNSGSGSDDSGGDDHGDDGDGDGGDDHGGEDGGGDDGGGDGGDDGGGDDGGGDDGGGDDGGGDDGGGDD
jgi:hypothetical protein